MSNRPAAVLLLVLLSPGFAGCFAGAPAADVLGTFYPMTFLAESVAGGRLTVGSIVPEGVEPHDWDPSVRDVARVAAARLVVAQDPAFEPWLARVLASLGDDAPTVVYTAEQILLDPAPPGDAANGSAGPGAAQGSAPVEPRDPHTWLDPVLFAEQAFHVRAAFRAVDPAAAAEYDAATIELVQRIGRLGVEYGNTLEACRTRHIVVQHDAFGHLARRYNLTVHAVEGLSPEAEANPGAIDRIVQIVRQHELRVVFAEPLVDDSIMEAIARETGARVASLNPLESRTPAERTNRMDYVDVMQANLAALADAMECTA